VLERAVTTLGARSPSTPTFSEGLGLGTGEAQTDRETELARSKNFEVFEKERGNIWKLNANSRIENEEPKPWGQPMANLTRFKPPVNGWATGRPTKAAWWSVDPRPRELHK